MMRRAPRSGSGGQAVAAAALAGLTLAACAGGGTSRHGTNATTTSVDATSATTAQAAPATGTTPAAARDLSTPGDIPDSQAYVAYTPPTGGYSVKVPEGWARRVDGAVVTFSDNYNSVQLSSVPAPSEPTPQSAQQSEVPAIKTAEPTAQVSGVVEVVRRPGKAVLITYRTDSRPNPVTGKVLPLSVERYEFWRNGTEVVITLSGPSGADNVDPWRTITDSLAWR